LFYMYATSIHAEPRVPVLGDECLSWIISRYCSTVEQGVCLV
jgi:hypothetical protein